MLNPPFKLFNDVKDQLDPGHLFVEIGTDRGGGSTFFLADLARKTGNDFVTVDIDPVYVGGSLTALTMSGEDFVQNKLPTMGKKVELMYLDGFDWTENPISVRNGTAGQDAYNLISEYEQRGLVLNNVNSAVTHTIQALGMIPFLADRSVVMFCDTWFNFTLDTFEGKGAGAVYLFLAEGFKIIGASSKSNYNMMGRGIDGNPVQSNIDLTLLNQKYTGISKSASQILYTNDN